MHFPNEKFIMQLSKKVVIKLSFIPHELCLAPLFDECALLLSRKWYSSNPTYEIKYSSKKFQVLKFPFWQIFLNILG